MGVVDTDIQSPGIHVLFGLGNSPMKYCLNDYLKGECAISDPICDVSDKLSLPPKAINLIPSRLNAQAIIGMLKEGFDVQKLSTAVTDLAKTLGLDMLFIDTHPGIEEDTLLSIAMSDALVVILRPDEQDYLGTAVTFEIAKRMEVPKVFLVANRVPQELDPGDLKTKLEETYKVPIIGVLPFSYGLMMAQSKEIYCFTSPRDPFSVATRNAAEYILKNAK